MAPETLDGERSIQSDLWSVGVMLQLFLCGSLPFPQTSFAALASAILSGPPQLPAESVPQPIRDVIATALRKDPRERFASASQMKAAIRDAMFASGGVAVPAGFSDEPTQKHGSVTAEPPAELAQAIGDAILSIEVKAEFSYGTRYVTDVNSRRVFARLQRRRSDVPQLVAAALRSHFKDADWSVRWRALRLYLYYSVNEVRDLYEVWETDSDAQVRELVLEGADQITHAERVRLVREIALYDDSAKVRRQALEKFVQIASVDHYEEVTTMLAAALSDRDEWVRAAALKNLASLQVPAGLEAAVRLITTDSSNSVRVAAAEALARMGSLENIHLTAVAFDKGLVNDYVFKESVKTLARRYGGDAVRAESARMASDLARQLLMTEVNALK
jgi:hypothetical protein